MPIYEYKCNICGEVSEFLEGVGQGQVSRVCGHCGSRNLSKVFSKSVIAGATGIGGPQVTHTCCGRTERCEKPPCSDGGICRR